jgi:hypothetical protein
VSDNLDRQIAEAVPDAELYAVQMGQPCFGHRWDLTKARARVRKLIEERERAARADSSEAIYSEGIRVGRQMARRAALEEACRAVCGHHDSELEGLISRWSMEADSNTPDFVLAQYLRTCLTAFNKATAERDRWYGVRLRPGDSHFVEPPASGTQGEGE